MVAIGGDVRFAASQILESDSRVTACGRFRATRSWRSAIRSSGWMRSSWSIVSACRPSRPRRWCRRCWSTATLLSETDARAGSSSPTRRCGRASCSTSPSPAAGSAPSDFEHQVLASAEALGHQLPLRPRARPSRRDARDAAVRRSCTDEHGLADRERLLLQVAALLHDIGIYVSLRAHHKHSQYLLAASQIFGLSDDETAIVANIARYHRRGPPQTSHLPYVALDRQDRLLVNKLAAILRLANALDAEHLQKVRDLRLHAAATGPGSSRSTAPAT